MGGETLPLTAWAAGIKGGKTMVSKKQQDTIIMGGILLLLAAVVDSQFTHVVIAGAVIPAGTGGNVGQGGTCQLAYPQTIANASYNVDTPGTQVGATAYVFNDASTGALNSGGTTTTPNTKYDVLFTATSYFAVLVEDFTTPCTVSPALRVTQKAVDTAITTSVYSTDGLTLLTGDVNLTIGASGSGTAHVKLLQSAAYKHLGGKDNKFAVFVNSTNASTYDPSQMSVVFDGSNCVVYGSAGLSNSAIPAVTGATLVGAWVCTGDFLANDGGTHDLAVKVQAVSGMNPTAASDFGVGVVGVDYYTNTQSGAVEFGAVKNSGAAIQAMQVVHVNVN